jgi:hypothetical protein
VQLGRNEEEDMPAILYDFLGVWRRYFPTVAALLSLASIIGVACNVAAEEPKHIRITLARSVSAIPLWGIGPFAEKGGFRVEYIPAGTNADMQRNLQSGIELGTLGYQSPAVMAEQNVANVKIIAGEQLGGQNLIVRKGIDVKSWKDLEGKRIGRPPGSCKRSRVAISMAWCCGRRFSIAPLSKAMVIIRRAVISAKPKSTAPETKSLPPIPISSRMGIWQ